MIRIAVVEDDNEYRRQIRDYIERYAREQNQNIEVKEFNDGADILCDYQAVYDIIFLDIDMKEIDGMSAAREIRKQDENVVLIFITNLAQYAINGYAVGALDYVLKPVSYFAFCQELAKAVRGLDNGRDSFYTVRQKGGLTRIKISQIYYVECQGHRLTFYTEKGEYHTTGTLKEVEEKFASHFFSRCNSGYLVNLRYVEKVEGMETVVAGKRLPVSRPRRTGYMSDLADYMGRG